MKYKKETIIFSVILLILCGILGFIYGLNNQIDINEYIDSLSKNNFLFIYHWLVILIFLFSTISILGIFIEIIYIGFEGVSIGYILSLFFLKYKLGGLLFAIINILISKGFFIICLIYLLFICINYSTRCIKNITGICKDYLIYLIKPLLKKYLVIFILITVSDIIIYFFGNYLLNLITFML